MVIVKRDDCRGAACLAVAPRTVGAREGGRESGELGSGMGDERHAPRQRVTVRRGVHAFGRDLQRHGDAAKLVGDALGLQLVAYARHATVDPVECTEQRECLLGAAAPAIFRQEGAALGCGGKRLQNFLEIGFADVSQECPADHAIAPAAREPKFWPTLAEKALEMAYG